jgi:hypothetical protein
MNAKGGVPNRFCAAYARVDEADERTKLTDIPNPSEPDIWDSQAAGIAVQARLLCLLSPTFLHATAV